ncbi:DUF2339 domain-containing protein [Caulobacter endophyticus]|uniref:DUF2339 domain-containing protein n=1 Tax=Caulobacter endophyticus TaxID=2172652 RepID=A0A2T9KDX8_9CAUL|nr:DUF2339 domain-containing protein [Caulobacter endophyticus]PVM94155.1 hypothetical protein DDF67_00360 [Caulobacter endophyticus]
MEWVFIVGLTTWIAVQHQSLDMVKRQLGKALADLEQLKKTRDWGAAPEAREGVAPAAPAAPRQVPPASEPPPAAKPSPWTVEPKAPEPRPEPSFNPRPIPAPAPRPPVQARPLVTREAASTWLAENGLAWIGGGGLALGGLLLVAYAAQKGIFTPPLRIAAAVVLGALMVLASEWILRRKAETSRHLLAASIAAGAGAVTLYGAVCAAHGLYHLIPFWLAAVLAASVSLGLLALSLRHGEPLALVAMVGAAATPIVTGISSWSPIVFEAYAILIGATGFALAAGRRWGWTSLAAAGGVLLLSVPPLADHQYAAAAVLVVLAAAGPLVALWRRRRTGETQAQVLRLRQAAMAALFLADVFAVAVWFWSPSQASAAAGVLSAVLLGLTALAIAARQVPAGLFAAPAIATVLVAMACLLFGGDKAGIAVRPPWLHLLLALIPLTALPAALRLHAGQRTQLLMLAGIATAVGASLAWPLLDHAGFGHSWTPAALLGLGMFGLAALIARRSETPSSDPGLAIWLAAAAEMVFLAIHGAVQPRFEPPAFAAAALVLAFAARRLPWSGLAQASVVGGLLALVVMLRPAFIGPALDGRLPLPMIAAASGEAALLAFAAAWLLKAAGRRNEAESQGAAALMILLLGLFIGVHVVVVGKPGDDGAFLLDASLRTLILLAAGLVLVLRAGPGDGPVARWRTLAAVAAGLAHGLLFQGLLANPWWGWGEVPAGPPLFNTLILSYLAPAVLLAVAAWRRPVDAAGRGWVVGSAVFGLLWAVLALRHGIHGKAMHDAGIGRGELAGYAVLALAAARGFFDPRLAARPAASWLARAAPVVGWIAVVLAILTFGFLANPWWGPEQARVSPLAAALLMALAHGAAAALLLDLSRQGGGFGTTARASAVGVLFVLVSLVVRYGFHGPAMGASTDAGGLETWTFSAVWAAFGLAVLSLGSARKDAVLRWAGLTVLLLTAGKVLLFDLARLEGVVRAASFLAVGALLLGGAVLVRRLNARTAKVPPPPDAD